MRLRHWAFLGISGLLIACGGGGGRSNTMVFLIAGSGAAGSTDGPGPSARFNNPVNCTLGPDGTLYVADFDNGRVRAISLNSTVSTLVNQANFDKPFGLAFAAGKLYVETDANDLGNRDATTGTIWVVDLATGAATVVVRNIGRPRGMVGLDDGRLVLSNLTRHVIQILDPNTSLLTTIAGQDGVAGFADGHASAAMFARPYGLARMADSSILVADQANNRIRRVTLTGDVSTFAGSGAAGYANGPRLQAEFDNPQDVETNSSGEVFVADNGNHRFRVVANEMVMLLSGDGIAGYLDASLLSSRYYGMEGMCITDDFEYIYVADGTMGNDGLPYNRIRKLCLE